MFMSNRQPDAVPSAFNNCTVLFTLPHAAKPASEDIADAVRACVTPKSLGRLTVPSYPMGPAGPGPGPPSFRGPQTADELI